jgi:predicted RNA-binding protein with RPS1 domain
MENLVLSKEMTISKAKDLARKEVMEVILTALAETYGEDNVGWVRTGESSPKNEIGVKVTTVSDNGEIYDLCVTTNSSAKEPMDRSTAKKTYVAFDFAAARQTFNDYIEAKAASDKEKADKKAAKIAKDEAKRNEASKSDNSDVVDF